MKLSNDEKQITVSEVVPSRFLNQRFEKVQDILKHTFGESQKLLQRYFL